MMEIRLARKLIFSFDIDQHKMDLKIPVLSLLPLLEMW
jgi:sensor histidine kinase YesM